MNSQDFLIINAVGAGAFILWYLAARGGGSKRPTQLNLKAQDSEPLVMPSEKAEVAKNLASHTGPQGTSKEKNLNVMFNYNGHCWDAYEVLGLPAGSNLKKVTEAYQAAIQRCDKNSVDFLETAYKAICDRGS